MENALPMEEYDVKITCKTCRKRFKVKSKKAIECDRLDCRVKYDSELLTLEFKDDFINEFMTDVKIIEDFQSPESSESTTKKTYTAEEWEEHLQIMGMCG